MSIAFKYAFIRIDELSSHVGYLEYVRQTDPERWRGDGLAAQYDDARRQLEDWLLSVRDGIDSELQALRESPAARPHDHHHTATVPYPTREDRRG